MLTYTYSIQGETAWAKVHSYDRSEWDAVLQKNRNMCACVRERL